MATAAVAVAVAMEMVEEARAVGSRVEAARAMVMGVVVERLAAASRVEEAAAGAVVTMGLVGRVLVKARRGGG